CANRPAPAMSLHTGSIARSVISGALPTSRFTAPCGRWKTTAGCRRRWLPSAGGRTRKSTPCPMPAGPNWRGGALSDDRTREVAVKLRGAAYGDTTALHAQVAALRAERAELLDAYRGFEKKQFPDPTALHGNALHQYLVLRGGIRAEESTVDWLDEVTSGLDSVAQENR